MLSRKNRLVKEKDYKNLYRRSPKIKGKFVSLRYLKNNLDVSRFGFIVSNKTVPKATDRNLFKRKFRVIIGEELNRIKPGFDVIIKLERAPQGIKP